MPIPIQRSSIAPATPIAGTNKVQKASGKNWLIIILAVLFLIAVVGFAWAYTNYTKAQKQLAVLVDPKAQQDIAKKDLQALVERVKKLVVLPEGEEPTVATITDAPALAKEQPFYKDAHNGDKLLVYMQAKKAFIYDPNRNILVNVGPIYVEGNGQQTSAQSTLNVEVRNGSSKAGEGTIISDEIKKMAGFTVVNVTNAGKNDYQGNILVDQTDGSKSTMIDALKTKYNATVVKVLPDGEKATGAEVLLIVGN